MTNSSRRRRRHGAAAGRPNSNRPSPSLLREVREAIKQLHGTASVYVTGGPASSSSTSTSSSSAPPLSSTVDEKLEQLKVSALSLKQRQDSDYQRLTELNESRKAYSYEIIDCMRLGEEHRLHLSLGKPPAHDIDTIIMKLNRQKEMTVEIVELSKVLTNSRLASFTDIVRNSSSLIISKDLQPHNEEFGEILDELREGLVRGIKLEVIQFKVLAKKMDDQIAEIDRDIANFVHVRDKCCCSGQPVCACKHELLENQFHQFHLDG